MGGPGRACAGHRVQNVRHRHGYGPPRSITGTNESVSQVSAFAINENEEDEEDIYGVVGERGSGDYSLSMYLA